MQSRLSGPFAWGWRPFDINQEFHVAFHKPIRRLLPLILALAGGFSLGAQDRTPSEADQIREELRQLKADYEQRLQRLEDRLQRLDSAEGSRTTNEAAAPPKVAVRAAAPGNTASTSSTNISVNRLLERQFQENTESREQALNAEPPPWRERAEQVLENFVDIHGYFRAGYGRSDEGGPQVAFQAPGALAKYRLGNEAENYGELSFDKNFYIPNLFKLDREPQAGTPTGPIAHVQVTMSIYNPYEELLSSSSTDFGLPEAWAAIGNIFEAQASMKFWAGSRFYRRHDIHINDFFFYNMSGSGGGVEDLELPFGKLAFAWIGAASSSGFSDLPEPDVNNKAGFSKANWDLRLYDVPLPLGKGEFGFVYARAGSGKDSNGNSAPDTDGVAFTFLHTRDKFLSDDGVNKFSLQFGTGAAKTFTSGFETFTTDDGVFIRPDSRNSWRFRATENFTATLGPHFSIGPALVYQLTDYGDEGGVVQWASAGVRPILQFNRFFSLALEAGVDWVKNEDAGTSAPLGKITLAPQVSLGGLFMSRPVIRGFLTYAQWGDDFRGQVGGNSYLDSTRGLTYGAQMEAWW
jgi:maltoporin